MLKVNNGRLSQVTDSPENELFPHFAPDDDRLVYERADIADGTLLAPDIFVIPTKGGAALNLTNSPSALDFQPTWSPDPETGEEDDN